MTAVEKFTTRATKVPVEIAHALDALAEDRLMTPSALLRELVGAAVAGEVGNGSTAAPGSVEAGVVVEIERAGYYGSEARVAAALNLARRVDTDPTNGAPNVSQLRALLDDLVGGRNAAVFDRTSWARLARRLRLAGFVVTEAATGRRFDPLMDWPEDGFEGLLD